MECAKKFVPGSVSYSRDWELKLRRAASSCAWRKRTTARMERRKTGDGSKLEMTVCRGWGKSSLATSYPCDATSEASGERSQAARARPKPVIAAGAAAALLQSRKPVLACGARSDVAAGGASRCQLSNWCPGRAPQCAQCGLASACLCSHPWRRRSRELCAKALSERHAVAPSSRQ